MKHITKTLLTAYLTFLPTAVLATSATFYSDYYQGRRMANGQTFSQSSNSVAHPSYRFGTRLRICYRNRCVTGVVRDRCNCSIDLSKGLFRQLAPLSRGRINVSVSPIR